MSILYRKKKSLTFAQLVPAWAAELARAETNRIHFERDLGHSLLEDMINGRLDNVGPLVDGRRLGLRIVTPENKAGFLEGHHVRELTAEGSTPQALSLVWNRLVVLKEAVLDFARRHELPPPSWWPVERERLLAEAGEGDAEAQSGVRMSEVPRAMSSQAPDILAEASRFANSPEAIRHTVATSLIARSRDQGLEIEEEILEAMKYRDANEYWHVKISEPMKATDFAHLLATHLSDPTERPSEFDRRTLVQRRIESSLRLALETGETWFIKARRASEGGAGDLEHLMLHPRAAAKWLLSLPKRRDLVPPGLRAFLERSERPGEREVPALGHVVWPPPADRNQAESGAEDGAIGERAEPLIPAPRPTIRKAIKAAYDAADAAGGKPPNIKELPAAVQPLLQEQGYRASGRLIQELGEALEFRHRRRPAGKTVSSEQRERQK